MALPRRTLYGVDLAADELATRLFALEAGLAGTKATTTEITREVLRWAFSKGWLVRTEAKVQLVVARRTRPRVGYVDVLVHRSGSLPDIAIEIDSEHKQWSLDKLRYVAAAGMHSIWIRWGDDGWAGIYDDVDVIQLPVMRRSRPRSIAMRQLTLWP